MLRAGSCVNSARQQINVLLWAFWHNCEWMCIPYDVNTVLLELYNAIFIVLLNFNQVFKSLMIKLFSLDSVTFDIEQVTTTFV